MSESTPQRYHPAHVALHWLMALLVILMLGAGKVLMPDVSPEDPQKVSMLLSHATIGITLTVLLVLRFITRFTTRRPAPVDAGSRFLNLAGKVVHELLYLMLIGMSLSGLGLYQVADLPAIFEGQKAYPLNFFEYLPRAGHGLTSWILLVLIALHVGAALFHQFIRKDNIFSRMSFGR